ncbi:hypothetical protein [Segnochrobactrum spirostomi]|uniref:DUF2269 family protein n=1 Tax=Segnochrobactrum spirostomi TaxID=2608987 RepID=A0A6A7XXV0_9HYPH|nr:hypothetical protein [Segnochrobactrum spirostomi]MQT11504.1 hypothetical protein [Segnochrobactrum spirostomi]
MRLFLKLVHTLAISAFVGSIFGHILLGTHFSAEDAASYRTVLAVKCLMTQTLILGGLALCVLSGIGLVALGRGRSLIRPWLAIKLAAVALIVVNAVTVLRPLGLERLALASALAGGDTQALAALHATGPREDIFGAINLALVLAVLVLSIARRVPFLPASVKPARA